VDGLCAARSRVTAVGPVRVVGWAISSGGNDRRPFRVSAESERCGVFRRAAGITRGAMIPDKITAAPVRAAIEEVDEEQAPRGAAIS
jgi:hypothetical protein